jgi:hypothetical protein
MSITPRSLLATISEEHVSSVIRVKEKVKQETGLLTTYIHAGFLLGLFLILKLEVIHSYKSLLDSEWTTWCYIPEGRNVQAAFILVS